MKFPRVASLDNIAKRTWLHEADLIYVCVSAAVHRLDQRSETIKMSEK